MNNDFCIEEEYEECLQEIKRLNNDIKILLKENEIKEKVIRIYDEVIDKAKQYVKTCKDNDMGIRYQTIEEILNESERYERRNNIITREK